MVGSGRWIVAGGLPTCTWDHPNRAIPARLCDAGGIDSSRGFIRNAGQSPHHPKAHVEQCVLCGITDGILKPRIHAGHVYHGPNMDTAQRYIRNTNRRVPNSWIQLYRGSLVDLENRRPIATPCH